MSPADLGLAVLQFVAIVAVGWSIGTRVIGWVERNRSEPADFGLTEQALAAIAGFVAFAVLMMAGNIVSRGWVFGTAGVVPAAGALVVIWAMRSGRPLLAVRPQWLRVTLAVGVLVALFVAPAVIAGSGVRTGDPPWHLGWTEQVLGGEPVPVGPAPEFARNAYPWGWHAVLGTTVRLVPGSTALLAHEALHLLIVLSIPLAAAALARKLEPRAGWPAAAASSLVGGWGWLAAHGRAAFEPSPGEARFGADLVAASPNSMYELLPPALPRELGLALLGLAAVLFAVALSTGERRSAIATGAAAGLAGLVSVPMFVTAVGWIVVATVASGVRKNARSAATALLTASVVFGLWALPVVVRYFQYGGFVDVSPRLGVEWPLHVALSSWGLLVPLAGMGIWVALRHHRDASRTMLAYAAAIILLLALSVARAAFDWEVAGNKTLLHQGRIWLPAHLLGAAFAGVAVVYLYEGIARWKRPAALAIVASTFMIGGLSPVIASRDMHTILESGRDGYVYEGDDLDPEGFVRRAKAELGPDDVVLLDIHGGDSDTKLEAGTVGFLLFQLSGARLVGFDDPRLETNDLRIRYEDLAQQWQATEASSGFVADFTLQREPTSSPTESSRRGSELVRGSFRGQTWILREIEDAR